MCFVRKLIKKTGNSERGFILLTALIAVLILMAVGFFALTMVSGDLMISYRLVGERKALSAAESGVHAFFVSSDYAAISETQVDPANDPYARYSVSAPQGNTITPKVHMPGYGPEYLSNNYVADVTGRDLNFHSSVTIRIGIADIPAPSSTLQGSL